MKTTKKQLTNLISRTTKAKITAWVFHFGQKDLGGKPYYRHCKFVAKEARLIGITVSKDIDFLAELEVLGYMHDLLEDTSAPKWLLSRVFGKETLANIEILTKNKNERYKKYIEACGSNLNTAIVKLADLTHNLDTSRLPYGWTGNGLYHDRLQKYRRSEKKLLLKIYPKGR